MHACVCTGRYCCTCVLHVCTGCVCVLTPWEVCEELSADALVCWTAAHRVSVSEYSWAQFGCQHNNVLGSILGEEGVLPGRGSPPPSLLWIMTSHPTPSSYPSGSSHRLRQVAGPAVASSGNCCPRAMRREGPLLAEGGTRVQGGPAGTQQGPSHWRMNCGVPLLM